VGEGDQVREDQTGVRRGLANGSSPRSAVAHSSVSKRSRTDMRRCLGCCKRRFRSDADLGPDFRTIQAGPKDPVRSKN
jgi:hypothetical protein